jgi:hypothetical protein
MMKIISSNRVFFGLFGFVAILVSSGVPFACGKSNTNDAETETKKPAPSPSPSPVPEPAPPSDSESKEFWVSSSVSRIVSRYASDGALKLPYIDLKSSLGTDGGISNMTMLDPNNLLAFYDPGVTGKTESLVLLDPQKGLIKSKLWYNDAVNLNQVLSSGMVAGFIANTLLIGTDTKILRLLYDTNYLPANNASVLIDANTLPDCPITAIRKIKAITGGSTKYLLVLSSGINSRLNILELKAGSPVCVSSYMYTADGVTTATDSAVDALQMPDGSVFVLYQSDSSSKIVKYSVLDGALVEPVVIFQDQGILGAKPTGLAARSPFRLLLSNTVDDILYEVTTEGVFTGFYVDNSFTQDITAIITD